VSPAPAGGSFTKKVMEVDLLFRADVTYPPSMITTGISCTAMSLRGERLNGFY